MSECLIIFSRYPEAGKTKTRMIPALGAKGAANLQQQMTEHTLNQAKQLSSFRVVTLQVHFAGGNQQLMQQWLGNDLIYVPQAEGDLGQKMYSAIALALATGFDKVVIIGIDCPDIDRSILTAAFTALEQKDLVLGPAADGGYYLIGLKSLIPQLFRNISWGTETVLAQTKKIANQLGLQVQYLPVLRDVDLPEDLSVWQKYQ